MKNVEESRGQHVYLECFSHKKINNLPIAYFFILLDHDLKLQHGVVTVLTDYVVYIQKIILLVVSPLKKILHWL